MTKTIALYMSSELRVLTNSVLPPGKHGQLLFDAAIPAVPGLLKDKGFVF